MSQNYMRRAIVDYRRATTPRLRELLQHCVSLPAEPYHYPTVLTIRAMIHHQTHRGDEALLELASARRAIAPIMRTEPGPKSELYFWYEADIFLREAEALIEGPTNAPAVEVNANAKAN